MATTYKVGQKLPLTIAFLDQNGQPMSSSPAPDSPPSWANLNPPVESLVAAPDGLSAEATGLSEGSDTIRVQAVVGGATFEATLDVVVEAAQPVQTLTSIQIVPGTPV